jgi:hypothetical protein
LDYRRYPGIEMAFQSRDNILNQRNTSKDYRRYSSLWREGISQIQEKFQRKAGTVLFTTEGPDQKRYSRFTSDIPC